MTSSTNIRAGDCYLVDLGQLVPVAGTSARDAMSKALTAVFGRWLEVPSLPPCVYQLDSEGEIVAVYQ